MRVGRGVRLQEVAREMVKPRPGRSGMAIRPSSTRDLLLDEVVEHRIGAERELDDEARGRGGADVQPGEEAGRSGPEMRREAQVEGAGQRADAHRLGDAAAEGGVGLEDVGGAQRSRGRGRRSGWPRFRRRRSGSSAAARTSAMPALSSAITGSSNQARSQSRDQCAGSAWPRRRCRCRARRPSARPRARARRAPRVTRAAETCGAPSMAPTRILTARKPPAGDVALELLADAAPRPPSRPRHRPAGGRPCGRRAAARPARRAICRGCPRARCRRR